MSSNTDSILSHETEALTILDSRTRVSLPGPETDVTRQLLDLQRATSLLLLGNLVVSSSRMTQPARGRSHLGEPRRTFWAIYVQTHPNLFAIIWQVRCAVCESEPQNFWSLIVSNDVRVVKFVFQISVKTDSVTWQPRFPNEALVLCGAFVASSCQTKKKSPFGGIWSCMLEIGLIAFCVT